MSICVRMFLSKARIILTNVLFVYTGPGHVRQDSMDLDEPWQDKCHCEESELLKPLELRKKKHQRCMAQSLVGTPNYIAPEVLLGMGM